MIDNNFDWGELPEQDVYTIKSEIIDDDVYCCFRDVKEGDIVMDIGASVGPFTKSILHKKPSKVYCIEPSISLFKTLDKNLSDSDIPIIKINKAIVESSKSPVSIFGSEKSFYGESFMGIIRSNFIPKINFLKIDCEGGEYSIFTDNNIEYLNSSVDYIAVEMHLRYPNGRENFKEFRDKHLKTFSKYKAMSCKFQHIAYGHSIDITKEIFNDNFIDTYNYEFMLYLSNSSELV